MDTLSVWYGVRAILNRPLLLLNQLRRCFSECRVGDTFIIICKMNPLPYFGIRFLILLTNLVCFYNASRIMHVPNPNAKRSQPFIELANTFHTHLKEPSLNHALKIPIASRVPLISEKPYAYSPLLKPIDIFFDILSTQVDYLPQTKSRLFRRARHASVHLRRPLTPGETEDCYEELIRTERSTNFSTSHRTLSPLCDASGRRAS
jgi:hypothetical protein